MLLPELAEELARQLMQIKAIKLSPQRPFRWASGRLSPIYCDNRIVLSYTSTRGLVRQGFVELSKHYGPINLIAGVATAGIPHGMLLADALELPFVYVRDKAKSHGRQNQIEGEVRGNERVLVIEDLISTGGSSLRAVQALEDLGCHIAGAAAIFTYGFPEAAAAFEAADCPLRTLTDYDILIQQARAIGYIGEADFDVLREWRYDPIAWSAARDEEA